jgi:hypothetical protein
MWTTTWMEDHIEDRRKEELGGLRATIKEMDNDTTLRT